MSDDLVLCPHCGKENLSLAARCVHCGKLLDAFFSVEGMDDTHVPSPAEDDGLSEMMRALHNEDVPVSPLQGEEQGSPEEPEIAEEPEQAGPQAPEAQDNVPEWLRLVRGRASVEDDASGELVKKVSSMDETLEQKSKSPVDDEFKAWIDRIRSQARQEGLPTAPIGGETGDVEGEIPEWLQRVRDLQPIAEDEDTSPMESAADDWRTDWDREGLTEEELEQVARWRAEKDKDQAAEEVIPEGEAAKAPTQEGEGQLESETEGEAGSVPQPVEAEDAAQMPMEAGMESEPQEVELEALKPVLLAAGIALGSEPIEQTPTDDAQPAAKKSADLLLLRSQNEKVALLKELIGAEGGPGAPFKLPRSGKFRWARVALSLLLLIGIIGAIVFLPPAQDLAGNLPAPALAFMAAIDTLGERDRVLVVFDYQASTSAEMELVAVPVLQVLDEAGAEWQALTVHPAGLWLSQRCFDAAGLDALRETVFLPGGSLGVLTLALGNESVPGLERYAGPFRAAVGSLGTYDSILLLSDTGLGVQAWMEQAAPWLGSKPFLVLSTQQEYAALLPYYDSGQISGYIAGLDQARALRAKLGLEVSGGISVRAYQIGIGFMLIILIVGMLAKAGDGSVSGQKKDGEGSL